jgi:TonB family protein
MRGPRPVALAAAITLATAAAARLEAQGLTFQRCNEPLATRDSTWSTVYAALLPAGDSARPRGRREPLPPSQREPLAFVLQELRARFVAPSGIAFALGPPFDLSSFTDDGGGMVPTLASRTSFTLHRTGRITGIREERPSLSSAFGSAIQAALVALGDSGVLEGVLLTYGGAEPPGPDSLRLALLTIPLRDTALASAPLLRVRLPVFRTRPAVMKPGNPPPRYPPEGRAAGVESEVLLQFVVDTAGRADMTTVRLLKANYREFVDAALRVLPEYRFEPATINECPARMYVQVPFRFDIRR